MGVTLLGGGLPTPDTIAGLTGWWEADYNVYEDAGTDPAEDTDPVQQWNSRSGSVTMGQATLGNRPIYRTNIVNGLSVIRFDASNDVLDSSVALSSLVAAGAKTIFTVHYHSSAATGVVIGDTAGQLALTLINTGADLQASNDDGAVDNATNTAQATATWTIGTLWHDGTNLRCGVNDTRTASLTSVASGNTASLAGTMRFGAGPAVANPLGGDIAAVVVYNVALSEADRQTVERYLASKYAINLPY